MTWPLIVTLYRSVGAGRSVASAQEELAEPMESVVSSVPSRGRLRLIRIGRFGEGGVCRRVLVDRLWAESDAEGITLLAERWLVEREAALDKPRMRMWGSHRCEGMLGMPCGPDESSVRLELRPVEADADSETAPFLAEAADMPEVPLVLATGPSSTPAFVASSKDLLKLASDCGEISKRGRVRAPRRLASLDDPVRSAVRAAGWVLVLENVEDKLKRILGELSEVFGAGASRETVERLGCDPLRASLRRVPE